jgi:hypothetical protein
MRIAEGFETACAYRQITGAKRHLLWRAQLRRLRRWFRHRAGHLLPDNDREGMQAAQSAVMARQSAALPFAIERCPAGFNDWAEITRPPVHMSTAS